MAATNAPEGHAIKTELSRDLSLFHVTMMGVGMMIGAGAFIGTGRSIAHAGPGGVLLTFALNGVLAVITGLAYAELSSAVPKAGGAYNFARIGFGQGVSFVAGWMEWFASAVAGSLYAVTFAMYTVHFLKGFGFIERIGVSETYVLKGITLIVACVFIYINYRGASETGTTGALMTLGQTLTLAFIALFGLGVALFNPHRLQNFSPFLPNGWLPILTTMGFTYVAFEGFEVIAQAGDEAIDPRRNLPKAIMYSLLIVILTYLGISFAVLVVESPEIGKPTWEWIGQYGGTGFAHAVSRLIPAGNWLVWVAVIFASTSALNATVYSATRVSYALGRDGMLPKKVAKVSRKRRVPHVALILSSVLLIGMALFLEIEEIASSASIMFLLLFFLVNISVIKIRRNLGDELTYGYLMPLFPILPIIAIVSQVFLAAWLVHFSLLAWIVSASWIAGGVIFYRFYSRSHAERPPEVVLTLQETRDSARKEQQIMLPVGNPENALQLIAQTLRLAEAKDAELHVLHMITVPDQIPLEDGPKAALEGEEAITEAMLYVSPDRPFNYAIRYCRNVARGILTAVREHNIDTVVLGWRGKSYRKDFVFGSTIDPVLERCHCNVVVFRTRPLEKFQRIVVPVSGGPNSVFALEVAEIFSRRGKGVIAPIHVYRPGSDVGPYETTLEEIRLSLKVPTERWQPVFRESRDVLRTLLKETENCDLVVIGASDERWLRQMVLGSLPEELAHRCDKPLIMVKAKQGIKSFIKKWI